MSIPIDAEGAEVGAGKGRGRAARPKRNRARTNIQFMEQELPAAEELASTRKPVSALRSPVRWRNPVHCSVNIVPVA